MATGIFTLRNQLLGLVQKAWTGTQKTNFVEYLVVAGGGGGGATGGGGAGTFNGGSNGLGVSGGGYGTTNNFPTISGLANTGGGGGGTGTGANTTYPSIATTGGTGGSGIVVIRYPSYLAQASSTTGSPSTYIAGPYRVYIWVASGTITF